MKIGKPFNYYYRNESISDIYKDMYHDNKISDKVNIIYLDIHKFLSKEIKHRFSMVSLIDISFVDTMLFRLAGLSIGINENVLLPYLKKIDRVLQTNLPRSTMYYGDYRDWDSYSKHRENLCLLAYALKLEVCNNVTTKTGMISSALDKEMLKAKMKTVFDIKSMIGYLFYVLNENAHRKFYLGPFNHDALMCGKFLHNCGLDAKDVYRDRRLYVLLTINDCSAVKTVKSVVVALKKKMLELLQ